MSDNRYGVDRQRQIDEVTAYVEARRQEAPPPPHPAVIEEERRSSMPRLLLLALAGLVVFSAGATIGRYTGPDYSESWMKGTATVEKCERRGPLTVSGGFGFYDACYLWVEWDRGEQERVFVEDPGFFLGERPGDTIRIGWGIARPEVGHWSVLELLRYVLGGIGGLMALIAALGLAGRVRERRRA